MSPRAPYFPFFIILASCSFLGYQAALMLRQRLPSGPNLTTPSSEALLDAADGHAWIQPWFRAGNRTTPEAVVERSTDDVELQVTMSREPLDRSAKERPPTSISSPQHPSPILPTLVPDVSDLASLLDSLVMESVIKQRQREVTHGAARRGIAFVKTHKCGSSTLGSVMFRYAARHRQRMPHIQHNIAAGFELQTGNITKCDVAIQHIHASKWKYALEWYTKSIAQPLFITILREPVSHYASWAHFYKLPETTNVSASEMGARRPMTLDEFVASDRARKNPMARSLGLFKAAQLEGFVSVFTAVLLLERFDEGLVILMRILGWDLVDLTYFKINDSHETLRRSWDGLPVTPSPRASQLSDITRRRIEGLTETLDTPLYKLAVDRFEAQVAQFGDSLGTDLASFLALQSTIKRHCSGQNAAGVSRRTRADFADLGLWTNYLTSNWKKSNVGTAACRWYALADLEYEKQIEEGGYAPAVAFSSSSEQIAG